MLITPVAPLKAGSTATFQLLKRGRTTILPQCAGVPVPTAGTTPSTAPTAGVSSGKAGTGAKGSGAGGAGGPIAAAAAGGSGTGAGSGLHTHPLRVNRYAKFATAGSESAMQLWADAASELAAYAAQLTAEGGLDAAQVCGLLTRE